MKIKTKAFLVASVVCLGLVTVAIAVPDYIFQRGIYPQITSTFNLGSTSYKWNHIYGNYVSSTAMSATTVCIGGDCQTAWPAGGTSDFPFTPTTNFGVNVNSTSTPVWFRNGLMSSTTAFLSYVSSTQFEGALVGNASTATALAANGADCSVGSYPLGVDASGAVVSCTDATTEIDSSLVSFLATANTYSARQTIPFVSSTVISATTFIGNLTGTASQCTAADSDSTWTLHNSYPSACSAGQYASAIGDTLTCSIPEGVFSWTQTTNFGANANSTSTPIWLKATLFSSTTAWLTTTKVANTLEIQDKLIPNEYTMAFTYNTSTAWTGTTTIYLAPSASTNGITFTKARCETDVGTTFVSLYDGTNRADIISASTTIGKFNFSTNNTFNDAESIRVDIGTPATAPTWTACRLKFQYTP